MEMNIIERDLRNTATEGFFFEAHGDSLTARRLNRWQWEVTFESAKGRTYTETMREEEILRRLNDMDVGDKYATYTPHFSCVKWSPEKVDKFMRGLCPKMCSPCFLGFTLKAEKHKDFVVLRQPNRTDWFVDGKSTNFKGVLNATRAKLNEDVYWEFSEI